MWRAASGRAHLRAGPSRAGPAVGPPVCGFRCALLARRHRTGDCWQPTRAESIEDKPDPDWASEALSREPEVEPGTDQWEEGGNGTVPSCRSSTGA